MRCPLAAGVLKLGHERRTEERRKVERRSDARHYARRNERMAMKAKVSTGVVSVLMMLLFLVSVDARGAGHGMGMHAFHAGGHFAPHHFGHLPRRNGHFAI